MLFTVWTRYAKSMYIKSYMIRVAIRYSSISAQLLAKRLVGLESLLLQHLNVW